jgi:hypothetical protein
MTKKDPQEVYRKELQRELLSAIRRQHKLEEKIERLRQKLRNISVEEKEIP